jgi:hypothetical protein
VITVSDYVPHEYVTLIFELEFEVQIQGYERKVVCLGFQKHLPELNAIGQPVDVDFQCKLMKGPGITLDNELIFSEQAAGTQDNVCDFTLRAYISTSN